MNKKKTIGISVLILVASGAVIAMIFSTEPEAERVGATKKTAMLVDVISVEQGNYRPTVNATGTVQPSKDITLSPRVGGEIVQLSEQFTPGSFVKKGEVLLRIDPADYQNALQLRKSDLRLAKADLQVEMGRQDVAQKDYELIGDELAKENRSLVLRKPQLESARANVESAEAAVRQAELNLSRTLIRAPFDAHIITRNANVGSQVAAGDPLGRLVGMDEYWVIANVPIAKIGQLTFSEEEGGGGSEVEILNETTWPAGQHRIGRLYRLVGALDDQTRLARVLITVSDPLARKADIAQCPPLMIGSFVETRIQARELQNVVRLNRDYLRKGQTVWVMEGQKLAIKEVEVLLEDAQYAYIQKGISAADRVVTTNLSTVVEGVKLRVEGKADSVQTQTAQKN